MEQQTRRSIIKNAAAAAAAVTGAATAAPAEAQAPRQPVWVKKVVERVSPPTTPPTHDAAAGTVQAATASAPAAAPKGPLFSSIISFGNLVFVAGTGAHFPGTIEEHTKYVLDEIEQNLIAAGSSMDKVLKVNVYLSDLADYARMNAAYQGRFGMVPPVRTTVAVVKGVPGDSLVEIDCIASL
jgi:2-iminobutanoate/2-iminopropanoate deaminase